MKDLFIEIFSEEIPARMQVKATEDLTKLVTEGLKKNELSFGEIKTFVTPRRLALSIKNIPEAQADVKEERRGPKVGAPEKAVEGFLRSVGLKLEDAEIRNTEKGDFYFAVIEKKGSSSEEVIKQVLQEALESFPWSKSMRWGEGQTRWVRPLHSMICLFGDKVINVEFVGKTTNNKTKGHRFLAPAEIEIKDVNDYVEKLRKAKVIVDREERKSIIEKEAKRIAEEEGFVLTENKKLLEEVTGLVEYPVPLIGKIDDEFMSVPSEVLVSSMAEHQKYFSLEDKNGKMVNRFIVVSNMETADNGKAIIAGNEKVLRARLSDAKFFWDNDRKNSLESRVSKLMERVFHAKLGSDFDKVQRIQKLAEFLSSNIDGADAEDVKRASLLCKADLTSEMVYEFTDLQGLMGRYYAKNDGEKDCVAEAIAEHYSPLGPSDDCPKSPVSVSVALADKIDTLVGFWLIEQKPTGSKDPFALRRAALGVIRLILENKIRLSLTDIFAKACGFYFEQNNEQLIRIIASKTDTDLSKVDSNLKHKWSVMQIDSLMRFFEDRLKVYLKDKGVKHDLISAVFEQESKLEDDLVRLLDRVYALEKFLETDDGSNLLIAYRRAANITKIEAKKDGVEYKDKPKENLFEQPEEKALFEKLSNIKLNSAERILNERFEEAMEILAELRIPVDAFFERVKVNCDNQDVRANRLKLLSAIEEAMSGVANFAKIES